MTTLSTHLRPAPYQYGLLTLRLLGKLGGNNRTFLRAPMTLTADCSDIDDDFVPGFECKWNKSVDSMQDQPSFSLQMPLMRAMAILEKVSKVPRDKFAESTDMSGLDHIQSLLESDQKFDQSNLSSLKEKLLERTVVEQANAAFTVVEGAIRVVINVNTEMNSGEYSIFWRGKESQGNSSNEDSGSQSAKPIMDNMPVHFPNSLRKGDTMLKYILKALFHATRIERLQERASVLLQGLLKHIIYAAVSHRDCVRREEDVDQVIIQKDSSDQSSMRQRPAVMQSGKLQPLMPFGQFIFVEDLKCDINYFIFNEALADILLSREKALISKALELVSLVIDTVKQSETAATRIDNETVAINNIDATLHLANLSAENLLSKFCQAALSCKWESRRGIYEGICLLLEKMDQDWCRLFEVELFHVAFFCMKDNPLEAALAHKEALAFFMRLLLLLYVNRDPKSLPSRVDHVFLKFSNNNSDPSTSNKGVAYVKGAPRSDRSPDSDAIQTMLVTELASNQSIVRFGARYGLEFLYDKEKIDTPHTLGAVILKHGSIVKKHLFSKSLRNLQLQDQIATIETFGYIVKHAPGCAPLSDSHVLVFLSESLKMMSVADGEMTSESISSSVIINKDGYSPRVTRNSCMVDKFSSLTHATSIFLREGFEVLLEGYRIPVKPELPIGVQLRVSSLNLFHEVLKRHSDSFLEAESSSSIGKVTTNFVDRLIFHLFSNFVFHCYERKYITPHCESTIPIPDV